MRKNAIFVLAILLILPAMLFTVSCAKKSVEQQPEVTAPEPAPVAKPAPEEPRDMAADSAAMERDRMEAVELARQQEAERQRQAAVKQFGSEDIHFEFDSAVLLPEAQLILGGKADFLSANNVSVTIEGHCDERGTDAYNMALGQRRAEAAKAFLVDLGIPANRISTISYGEERPVDPGTTEEAYAKNRRDHFVIN